MFVFVCIDIYAGIRIIRIAKELYPKKDFRKIQPPEVTNRKEPDSDGQSVYSLDYRTASNFLFKFRYIYKKESWRAYILCDINYNGRSTALNATHRHFDSGMNRHYVCWSGPVTQLDDMVSISKKWAEATVEYIESGKRF